MARLLIVSRSMALAMRLADQHEVNEHPVDDLEALGTDLDADVLVLDIGDPMQAVTTVNNLREAGQVTPVLLVSGYQPEWEQVEAQQVEGVVVVPLPITRAALLAGIAQLTGAPQPVLDTTGGNQVVHEHPTPDDAERSGQAEPDTEPDAQAGLAASGDDIANGTATPGSGVPGTATPSSGVAAGPGPAVHTGRNGKPPGQLTRPASAVDAAMNGVTSGRTAAGPPANEASGATDDGTGPADQPLNPPWGETVRVSAPAAGAGQDSGSDEDTGSHGPLGPPSRRLPRLGNRPRKLQRRPNVADTQGMGLVTDPLGPRTDPYGVAARSSAAPLPDRPPPAPAGMVSGLDRRLDSEAAALAGDRPARTRPVSGIVMRPADLVQSLLDQVGDLYGVSDTAQVLADDVIERADADAAAILVPDGPVWRVSGGVGLRPLERRLILESTHWLITEIGSAGRAVLIDDTDIIRPQLSGAPLAAWRHLLAVPVPDVRAIVVLARGQEAGPFTDRDLAAVIAPVREAAALLAQAVQTRRLARALSSLREADPETTRRT